MVESWERLIRQVCLRLGGELGQKTLPVQRAKRGTDQGSRRADLADQLCEDGRLHAELRIEGTTGILAIVAEAPADLHIETLVEGQGGGPRGTLERLRPEPGDLLPKDGERITGFRLSLFKSMGSTRGNAESGFIRSVDDAVDRFHAGVVAQLERRPARRAAE